jgi:hypothetical protein
MRENSPHAPSLPRNQSHAITRFAGEFLHSPTEKVEYDVKEIRYPLALGWSIWCHEDSEVSG